MHGERLDRRTLLRLGSVAGFVGLAGCGGQQGDKSSPTAAETNTPTGTAADTATETAEPTLL